MENKTRQRVLQIRRRARQLQKKRENTQMALLSVLCICLTGQIAVLIHATRTPGICTVAAGYGAVLLQNGADAYVVVAVAAFMLGMALAVAGIRWKKRCKNQDETRGV